MAFLGIGRKSLEKIKPEEVKAEATALKGLEQEGMRRMAALQDQIQGVRLYAQQEKLTEGELEQCAGQIEDLENDKAAAEQDLSSIRKQKQTLEGFARLQRQRERLKKSGIWSIINKMDSAKLEDSLRKLGALDAKTSESMDTMREVLGVPTTTRDVRSAWTPRKRQILEEIKQGRTGQYDKA